VHLLPCFDFSSVPDLASEQKIPVINQPISAPDSEQPEDAIDVVKDQDGFNWGYDPYHYGTPEGTRRKNKGRFPIPSRDASTLFFRLCLFGFLSRSPNLR
jgi:pullulanase/glycogen debranching enzyme